MKILFLCTAHSSLSQRLYVALAEKHTITIELALSDNVMIEAAQIFQPDVIVCPFLTTAVPEEIYSRYLTLIVHPGPPGDAGPSSLDWLLIGDDGSVPDAQQLLKNQSWSTTGRSHWGVTVLQATETFDAGPIWAFEQFRVQIDKPGVTKSSLYRGAVTRAALTAVSAALSRVEMSAWKKDPSLFLKITPCLMPSPEYKDLSVTIQEPFAGGPTHVRPLLKAADREFNINTDTAKQISRKIRCADSQPGCLSSLFGTKLYLYGGIVEDEVQTGMEFTTGAILECKDEAVCVKTSDGKGIWITHLRRMKRKQDVLLWPKVPAVSCLQSLNLLNPKDLKSGTRELTKTIPSFTESVAFQEVRVEFGDEKKTALVYFDFYNGAMSTDQCSRLIQAFDFILATSNPLRIVLMGSNNFFSNGIHLNVIETANDPPTETWKNINRINDVVYYLLHEFPKRNIVSVAALRGNAAAGGVALAAAADHVVTGSDVVLNPAYRAIGLHGSEYHTLSYRGRCGATKAASLLRSMLPLSATNAQSIGLVDHVLHASDLELDLAVRRHVSGLVPGAPCWKTNMDLGLSTLQKAEALELAEMAKDCWSPRVERFSTRRTAFCSKVKATATPLRFAVHRRSDGKTLLLDEEERDDFDSVSLFAQKSRQAVEDAACRNVLQHLMTNVLNVFGKALKTEMKTSLYEEKHQQPQPQLVFPCYYQTPS